MADGGGSVTTGEEKIHPFRMELRTISLKDVGEVYAESGRVEGEPGTSSVFGGRGQENAKSGLSNGFKLWIVFEITFLTFCC